MLIDDNGFSVVKNKTYNHSKNEKQMGTLPLTVICAMSCFSREFEIKRDR